MRIELSRCSGDKIRADVASGVHTGTRQLFTFDLDKTSRRKVVTEVRNHFEYFYGVNRNSIKSEWIN